MRRESGVSGRESCERRGRRRIKRIALGLLLAGIVWCAILATAIWRYGERDHAVKSDCIIVLGAAVQGAEPSPVFEERIRHGITLYQTGYAPRLLFTGGIGEGQRYSESSVGRRVATQQAVPASDILIEERSHTTRQNLFEARAVMRQRGLKSAIVVSDPLHLKRAMAMASDLDILAVSSPTPTTRYRSLQSKLGFLVREIYFYQHYLIAGD
jgi:uncharacterized SAM-binding protein YcdF (DUF218 family)